jgi:hypothetical protein
VLRELVKRREQFAAGAVADKVFEKTNAVRPRYGCGVN